MQMYSVVLKPSKHKKKSQLHMIITSSGTGESVRRYSVNKTLFWIAVIVLSLIVGSAVGLVFYEKEIWDRYRSTINGQADMIADLEKENLDLKDQIDALNGQIQILSDTVNIKVASEAELAETIEQQSIPNAFPLSGSASFEIQTAVSEDDTAEGEEPEVVEPMVIFTATDGTFVVAAGSGTVTKIITNDAEFGNAIYIDHGNGYVSIYRNQGDPIVKEGDIVSGGNSLIMISSDNDKLGYQIELDGELIDPMDVLEISG